MRLKQFIDEVYEPHSDTKPTFCLSMDLRPNADGRSQAQTILRGAWADLGNATTDIDRMFSPTIERAREVLEDAMRDGTQGIFLLASADEAKDPWGLWTEVPCRNDLRVSERPWLFEIERVAYLTGRPIVSVFASRDGVDLMRTVMGEIESASVERPAHALRKTHGRTYSENIVGSPDDFGGGHAWNKVENIVEEHRAAAAREGAGVVADLVQQGDILVVAGPEESRSELINALPEHLQNDVREHEGRFGTERERLEWATELAQETQFEAADALSREILSGERGELIARGRESVDVMFRDGRVGELVVHEDAVSHWGTATDARRVEAPWDDGWYGDALWKARDTSAEVLFCRLPQVLEEHQGVVATLRW